MCMREATHPPCTHPSLPFTHPRSPCLTLFTSEAPLPERQEVRERQGELAADFTSLSLAARSMSAVIEALYIYDEQK